MIVTTVKPLWLNTSLLRTLKVEWTLGEPKSLGLNWNMRWDLYLDLNEKTCLQGFSLIGRTDKVELIATEFFQQPCDCLGYLEQHTKSCKSYLVGKYIYIRLKIDHFMLKVTIEDYCLVIWTLLLQLF